MTELDLDQVLEIERASFPSPWAREHFEFELSENRWAVSRVVKRGDDVIAYAMVWHLHDELKINNIAVHAAWRRRGVGDWLLKRILDAGFAAGCRVARLEVRPSNGAARRLYERHGFIEIGRRKGYYQREAEDAILMEICDPGR